MKPEQQRIAIADACGWTCCGQVQGLNPHGLVPWRKIVDYTTRQILNHEIPMDTLPDYLNNLNAMHEAEKALNPIQAAEYAKILTSIAWQSEQPVFAPMTAKADQRAEAFLRTLGLWEETE